MHAQGEETSVSTRGGQWHCLVNMPPSSSFKLETCPGLLQSAPLGNEGSQLHAERVWLLIMVLLGGF